jgi:hypothetical protein
VGGVTRRNLESNDEEDEDEHLDSETSSDHNDSSNESDDDVSTDPDEIIDLPLPAEARIERKTSQMSLRRRRAEAISEDMEQTVNGRDLLVDPARRGDAPTETREIEAREREGVWESVKWFLRSDIWDCIVEVIEAILSDE